MDFDTLTKNYILYSINNISIYTDMSNFYKSELIKPENYGYVSSYRSAIERYINNPLFKEMVLTHFEQKKIRIRSKIQKVPFTTVQKFTKAIEKLLNVTPYIIDEHLSIPNTKGFSILYLFSMGGLFGFGRKHFLVFQQIDNPNIIANLYEVI